MKKLVLFLSLVLCFICLPGCSKSDRVRELKVENNDVAILYIYSDNGNSETSVFYKSYGHAFLSLENISSNSLVLGNRTIQANETVTFGLWPIKEHFGVWFNVESNYINEYNKYPDRVSISIGVNLEDISQITTIIKQNNEWTPLFNCSKFALKVWNSVAENSEKLDVFGIISPNKLIKEIKMFKEYEYAKEIKTTKEISYYKEG